MTEPENFNPATVELFENPIKQGPLEPLLPLAATLESRTEFMQDIQNAMGLILNRIAEEPSVGFPDEAWKLLPEKGQRFEILTRMPILPRHTEQVPESLIGALELLLRAAESGARLGPVYFGYDNLPAKFWLTMRRAAEQGLMSHALLTVWAAFGNVPASAAQLADASNVAKND